MFLLRSGHRPLTEAHRRSWRERGYVRLEGLYDRSVVARLDRIVDDLFTGRPENVTVDDIESNRRMRMRDVVGTRFERRLKINDLYLSHEEVREALLDASLTAVLHELLGHEPVLCNTLSIDRGTQQPRHVDTLFMTPQSDDHLIATWTPLEDVHAHSGPLFYYPGSHLIPPYRFSHGGQHVEWSEFAAWEAYVDAEIERRGLVREVFLPRAGDVFIWHARLVHGGSPIEREDLTRRSLVAHYYSGADCELMGAKVARTRSGGAWLDRPPQPVPA